MSDDDAGPAVLALRDWLAGQALAGILANPNHRIGEVTFDRVCTNAYEFADAMLIVRGGAITGGGNE